MRALRALARVIFWTYSRGTWQYDVLCALILAFIFLTPRDFFSKPPFYSRGDGKKINEEKDRPAERERTVSLRLSPR
jgi:hypothetical protein